MSEGDDTNKPMLPLSGPGESGSEPPIIEGFVILRELGAGGMGVVYLAEQRTPIKRLVAVKVIKPGLDSKQAIARFEAERQTLALLDHPNIAHVLNAGTTADGRLFFVMEYVGGKPLTEYCDEHRISIEGRLRLFLQVCEGVQYAHQKGIVHRDLKPSNILVADLEGQTVPKIIDFGVAKAIHQPLTERTLFTEQGQLIGTPEYMSPEQAGVTQQDVDTRSDIYSLGIVLYELLTGRLPFDRKTLELAAYIELLRIVREQDPPRPSARLSGLGEDARAIAERRSTQVATLIRHLRRELEWIPLKAIRKQPDHRYRTAVDLADDVRNYLEGAPLNAGPESRAYRARKFMRRHRALVTGVTVVVCVLALGVIVSVMFAVEAERERAAAANEAEVRLRALYLDQIALAQIKIDEGDLVKAQTLLGECPADLRSWEWDWLNCVSDRIVATFDVGRDCEQVIFSPDGKRVASGSSGGTISIYDFDAALGAITPSMEIEAKGSDPQFNPDGSRLAVACGDCIQIWDTNNGRKLSELSWKGTRSFPEDLVFLPNGQCIAAVWGDDAGLWDVESGRKLAEFVNDDSSGMMRLSPDGKRIAVQAGEDPSSFYVWRTDMNHRSGLYKGHHTDITCLAFCPDSALLATGSEDGVVKIWDTDHGQEVVTLQDHKGRIADICFDGHGRRMATASDFHIISGGGDRFPVPPTFVSLEQSIRIWDTQTWHCDVVFENPQGPTCAIAMSPEGDHVASVAKPRWDESCKAAIWNVVKRPVTRLTGDNEPYNPLEDGPSGSFSDDGNWLIVDRPNDLQVMPACTGEVRWRLVDETYSSRPSRLAADRCKGTRLVTLREGCIEVWDWLNTERAPLMCIGVSKDILGVALGRDGNDIFAVWQDVLRMVDTSTGDVRTSVLPPTNTHFSGPIVDLGRGKIVVVTSAHDSSRELRTGDRVFRLDIWGREAPRIIWEPSSTVVYMGVVPGGQWLGAAAMDWNSGAFDIEEMLATPTGAPCQARFWRMEASPDFAKYRESRMLSGWPLGFSPDARRALCVRWPIFNDGRTQIYDTESGAELLTLRHPDGFVRGGAFSPDGRQIVTCGGKGSVVLWDTSKTRERVTQLLAESSLPSHATTDVKARSKIPVGNLEIPPELEACADNLRRIYAAVAQYKADAGRLPDWLSDLVPGYLGESTLLCPTHPDRTSALYYPDPKLPCGYSYEFSPSEASSRLMCREWKELRLQQYGYVVPIVRCVDQDSERVLNVSLDGQVYWSSLMWETLFRPKYLGGTPDADSVLEPVSECRCDQYTSIAGFCPEKPVFAVILTTGEVVLIDALEQRERLLLRQPGEVFTAFAFLPDGESMVLGTKAGRLYRANLTTGQIRFIMAVDAGREIARLDAAANGGIAIGLGLGSSVERSEGAYNAFVYDSSTGKNLVECDAAAFRDDHQGLALSATGNTLAIHEVHGNLRETCLFRCSDGREINVLYDSRHGSGPLSVAMGPDDTTVAVGYATSEVIVWNGIDATIRWLFEGHTNWVVSLAFSEDQRYLASGAGDSSARVYDLQTGKEVGNIYFPGPSTYVHSVDISSDGLLLLAAIEGYVGIYKMPRQLGDVSVGLKNP